VWNQTASWSITRPRIAINGSTDEIYVFGANHIGFADDMIVYQKSDISTLTFSPTEVGVTIIERRDENVDIDNVCIVKEQICTNATGIYPVAVDAGTSATNRYYYWGIALEADEGASSSSSDSSSSSSVSSSSSSSVSSSSSSSVSSSSSSSVSSSSSSSVSSSSSSSVSSSSSSVSSSSSSSVSSSSSSSVSSSSSSSVSSSSSSSVSSSSSSSVSSSSSSSVSSSSSSSESSSSSSSVSSSSSSSVSSSSSSSVSSSSSSSVSSSSSSSVSSSSSSSVSSSSSSSVSSSSSSVSSSSSSSVSSSSSSSATEGSSSSSVSSSSSSSVSSSSSSSVSSSSSSSVSSSSSSSVSSSSSSSVSSSSSSSSVSSSSSSAVATTITRYVDTDLETGNEDGTDWDNAYFTLSDWDVGEATNLVTANQIHVVNVRGAKPETSFFQIHTDWTTSSTHDITIQVDSGSRHLGSWDDTKYSLEVNGLVSQIRVPWVTIDGLQVYCNATSNSDIGFVFSSWIDTGDITIKNCIFWGETTNPAYDAHSAIELNSTNMTNAYIYNNIMYGWNGGPASCGIWNHQPPTVCYAYNNTMANCRIGIYALDGTTVAINNIVQDSISGFLDSAWGAASDYNITDDATTPGGDNHQTNVILDFLGYPSNNPSAVFPDLHLAPTDVQAIGTGLNLLGDANLSFSTDIDGHNRYSENPSQDAWDIGADQTPFTIIRYIDTDVVGGDADGTSWANAYATLSAWDSAEETDLTASNEIHIVNCRGVADDTTSATFSGWTTDDTRYLKILGDVDSAAWDDNKYTLYETSQQPLNPTTYKFIVEGLQIFVDTTGTFTYGIIGNNPDGGTLIVDRCFFRGSGNMGNASSGTRLNFFGSGSRTFYCLNSIFVDFISPTLDPSVRGLWGSRAGWTSYLYNNTVVNCTAGLEVHTSSNAVYNNLVYNCLNAFTGTINGGYNSTDAGTATGNVGDRVDQSFAFNDYQGPINPSVDSVSTAFDFHLTAEDTGAIGWGLDLSDDSIFPFNYDISNRVRPNGLNPSTTDWDIGASEWEQGTGYSSSSTSSSSSSETPTSSSSSSVSSSSSSVSSSSSSSVSSSSSSSVSSSSSSSVSSSSSSSVSSSSSSSVSSSSSSSVSSSSSSSSSISSSSSSSVSSSSSSVSSSSSSSVSSSSSSSVSSSSSSSSSISSSIQAVHQ